MTWAPKPQQFPGKRAVLKKAQTRIRRERPSLSLVHDGKTTGHSGHGPMLQEEALKIAEVLGNREFKAFNGWLNNLKKRHNIGQFVVSGESADVSEDVVVAWHDRLRSLLSGYKMNEI